jgi:hypothetical protein
MSPRPQGTCAPIFPYLPCTASARGALPKTASRRCQQGGRVWATAPSERGRSGRGGGQTVWCRRTARTDPRCGPDLGRHPRSRWRRGALEGSSAHSRVPGGGLYRAGQVVDLVSGHADSSTAAVNCEGSGSVASTRCAFSAELLCQRLELLLYPGGLDRRPSPCRPRRDGCVPQPGQHEKVCNAKLAHRSTPTAERATPLLFLVVVVRRGARARTAAFDDRAGRRCCRVKHGPPDLHRGGRNRSS